MIAISGDLTNGKKDGDVPFGTITTIAESPLKFGLLYVGTDDGNIQLSKDGGYTWTLINSKPQKKSTPNDMPSGLWVSRVIASQFKEGRVYVTLNGYRLDNFNPYLFVSEDFGATWKILGKNLPAEPINVIREDQKYDSILYVGTDGGLYVSIDAGNNFMMWNKGLPKSVPIHDIAIQQRENEIVLGTHGRSLYIGKLDSVQLLLKSPEYRQAQQASIDKTTAFLHGPSASEIYKKEGVDVDCPPLKPKKTKSPPERTVRYGQAKRIVVVN
jgi:ligand-binding sensor domain-containing protein